MSSSAWARGGIHEVRKLNLGGMILWYIHDWPAQWPAKRIRIGPPPCADPELSVNWFTLCCHFGVLEFSSFFAVPQDNDLTCRLRTGFQPNPFCNSRKRGKYSVSFQGQPRVRHMWFVFIYWRQEQSHINQSRDAGRYSLWSFRMGSVTLLL